MEDDMYPNDGVYFLPKEPKDQVIARQKEKAETLEAIRVLEEAIARFEDKIKFYGSVDAMPVEVKTDPAKFMNMHNSNQMTRDNLVVEKEYLEDLLKRHMPSR